ncbi:MAG: hypothetical protein MUC69_08940 [Gemmatimonadales bacterium]|nr:hypothetical protein [Gemmatimonadales bacterium]
MQSPLVVEVYREQLAAILDWHRHEVPGFRWGVVLHKRNEHGHARFGAVTLGGESLLLTAEQLDELSRVSCWLDGAVRVRLECRSTAELPPELAPMQRADRAALVRSLAIYFDPGATGPDAMLFAAMAGELTPESCPTDLYLFTRRRPPTWPA